MINLLLIAAAHLRILDKHAGESQFKTDVVMRLIGRWDSNLSRYQLVIQPKDHQYYSYNARNGVLTIKADRPSNLARGFKKYLQTYCNVSIFWFTYKLNLPTNLPDTPSQISHSALVDWRYFLNFCTFSYSYAFYQFQQWELQLDLMAMHGVSHVLVIQGQQKLWQNILRRLKVNQSDINQFMAGPGFEAWWLLSNLFQYGVPLTQQFIDKAADIQRKIIIRLRQFGMEPIGPLFYASVPRTLKKYYPNQDIRDTGYWITFPRPSIINPDTQFFRQVASIYYQEHKNLFGQLSVFAGDPFHEGGSTTLNLTVCARQIYKAMNDSASKPAIWVLQGWGYNPNIQLLKGLKKGQTVILDLMAQARPKWNTTGFNDNLWIWNCLPNYGGRLGLYGKFNTYQNGYKMVRQTDKNNIGLGMAPQGTQLNFINYEYIFDMAWTDAILDVDSFVSNYVRYRYQKQDILVEAAWLILRNGILNSNLSDDPKQSLFCARPAKTINAVSSTGSMRIYYSQSQMIKAWSYMHKKLDDFKSSRNYIHDLVDLARQCMADYAQYLHKTFESQWDQKDIESFNKTTSTFLQAIDDQDKLLGTLHQFNFGNYYQRARKFASTSDQQYIFTRNLKLQLTTWSEIDSQLHEYSHKQWAGLLKDFYRPRWVMYFQYKKAILQGKNATYPDFHQFQFNYAHGKQAYQNKTSGDPVQQLKYVYDKYFTTFSQIFK